MTSLSSLPERLAPKVELRFDRKDWPLVFTHDVLLACDELTGGDILAGIDLRQPRAKLLRALLCLSLRRAGASYTLGQVGERLTPQNIPTVQDALCQAWMAAMPEPETDEDPPEKRVHRPVTWLEAWAIARYDLGLTDADWLGMTPRQLHALRKRQLERMQREELLVGIVASTSANFGFCRPNKPLRADSFMLHPLKAERLEPVTAEDIRSVFACMGQLKGDSPLTAAEQAIE